MNKKILLASIVLLTTACSHVITPTPVDSGITGTVTVGPMCPVMIQGQDCPDQPYQANITVKSLEGKNIVQFHTDEQGNFKVPLAPGDYILHPEPSQGKPLPFAADQQFTVKPGEFTRLTVTYDSGIR